MSQYYRVKSFFKKTGIAHFRSNIENSGTFLDFLIYVVRYHIEEKKTPFHLKLTRYFYKIMLYFYIVVLRRSFLRTFLVQF